MKRLSMSVLVMCSALASLPAPAQGTNPLLGARPGTGASAPDDVKGEVRSNFGGAQLASQNELMALGNIWSVNECCGWTGTWTRRPGTNLFNAMWRHTNGTVVNDTITLAEWNKANNQVLLVRHGVNGTYRATYNPSARSLSGGNASWYPAGASWNATLR